MCRIVPRKRKSLALIIAVVFCFLFVLESNAFAGADQEEAETEAALENKGLQERELNPSPGANNDCNAQIQAAKKEAGDSDWPYGFYVCECVPDGTGQLAANCVYKRDYSCFTPETLIQMADGSMKRVDAVRKGDLVWNPALKKGMRVANTLAGPEKKPMYEIGYGEKTVRVTETHPMLVAARQESGMRPVSLAGSNSQGSLTRVKRADQMSVNDFIMDSDGELHKVSTVLKLPLDPNQVVWNFELDSSSSRLEDHLIVADGIVTADVRIQAKLNNYLLPWDKR